MPMLINGACNVRLDSENAAFDKGLSAKYVSKKSSQDPDSQFKSITGGLPHYLGITRKGAHNSLLATGYEH